MPVTVDSLLAPDGAIARRLADFEPRPQQVEMARAVEAALEERERLLVEAGTGVGKSFAYLLPAIRRIVDHRERVVVATNTINLQEQLVEKDVPLLNAVIPEEFSAVLVKGRSNYVSLRRLKLASERQDKLFGDDDSRHSLHLVEDWAYATRDGTRSTLPVLPRTSVWDFVQSDAHNCMGRKCPTYDKCFYQAARRRMENGDLLICNHALFFADLALRGRGVGFLPPYQHVILDEAHCAEDVAAEHFGLRLASGRVEHLLRILYHRKGRRGFLETLRLRDDGREAVDGAIRHVLACEDLAAGFFAALATWQQRHGAPNGRVAAPGIVDNGLSPALRELADRLRLLKGRAAREADAYELNGYAQRAADIARDADNLVGQTIGGCVYWIELAARRGRAPAVSLNCMAVDVGEILAERLFDQDVSVVMTSATLATGPGDFRHVAGRLGCPSARTLQLGSPFDHGRQMQVFVDRGVRDPRDAGFADSLAPSIERHVRATDGGALVLFTSFRAIEEIAARLGPALEDYPLLVQGRDGPPGLLLRRFRGDERSVLLGTASFWQGVDVRGPGLRNVIITRLPFDVPDRPLVEARLERVAEQGGHPFLDEQVPRAVIRFKQGIGRLIRSGTDRGRIVVLDPRVVTKPYGRAFLRALPEDVEIVVEGEGEEGLPAPGSGLPAPGA